MNEQIFMERKEKVLEFIQNDKYKPMKIKELATVLQVPKKDRIAFERVISNLESDAKIFVTKKGNVSTPERSQIVVGTFLGTARSFGFVSPDDPNIGEIFIPPSSINGAMHKDKVYCRVTFAGYAGKKDEGDIIKILERGYDHVVGTFISQNRKNYVIPDNKKLGTIIFIPKNSTKDAVPGHKVVVTLKNNEHSQHVEGNIIEILGHKNDPGVDVLSIISQLGIRTTFPPDVIAQIETIPLEVLDHEKENRRDLRDKIIITIDGDDTKDVDDAISIERLNNGDYKLGVYIADVTHYVKECSPLDVEALARGTSVYLVDTVIPMLPFKLSNGICSLDENVDRLSLGCEMIIDQDGNLVSHEIFESILNVSKKTTYNIVNDLLVNPESEYLSEYNDYLDMINLMQDLSRILKKKRVIRGAIEFDFPEAKIITDDNGKPIDVVIYERNIATGIIEEFMLMCNETVSEQYFWLEMPFVYRTHEEPDEEKLATLIDFIKNFGYSIKSKKKMKMQHPKNLQNLLDRVKNTPEENIISRVMLRSLKQARYTDTNFGHFGLAAQYYSHFTSPIRRYPDLQIHRIIKENLKSKLDESRKNYYNSILPEVCKTCSRTERTAEEAEREVDKLRKIQFMEDKIGEVFDAIISSVTSWGIYVSLPNTIEGMIFVETLPKDTYIFNDKRMQYVGHKKGLTFSLGDKVKVKLTSANVAERKLDFIIFDPEQQDSQPEIIEQEQNL